MPLATKSIEEIFGRMLIRYAAKFERNYAQMNMAAVKADWAEVLDGLTDRAIAFGLVNLPIEWPPNAAEFREVCCRAPIATAKQVDLIPGPKPDPVRLAAELQRLHDLLKDRPPKQWAYDLQAREKAGENLNYWQRISWREALRTAEEMPLGIFQKIKPEALPPALRPDWIDPNLCADLEASTRDMLYAYRHRQQLAAEGRA